ncbi:MAG: peptide deformylase [Thermodesulfobacteriota bacterium]|nr:peptide deformylase [Thermodesulfobacteriota bacterium]
MADLKVYPDTVLRKKTVPVETIDGHINRLIYEMAETMYMKRGIGLAAPQVGVSQKIVVVDIGEGLIPLINPVIVEIDDENESFEEGCLSLPDIALKIDRSRKIVVKGINLDGNEIELEVSDLLARVFQHEVDHLEGTLIIDRVSGVQKELLKSKLKKLRKNAQNMDR